jgi:hypothetical protein
MTHWPCALGLRWPITGRHWQGEGTGSHSCSLGHPQWLTTSHCLLKVPPLSVCGSLVTKAEHVGLGGRGTDPNHCSG